jgi:hypothetical protein
MFERLPKYQLDRLTKDWDCTGAMYWRERAINEMGRALAAGRTAASQPYKSAYQHAWARWGSNPRPTDYESAALTTELQARLNLLVKGHV